MVEAEVPRLSITDSNVNIVRQDPALTPTRSESIVISDDEQPVGSSMPAIVSVSCPYTFVCEDTQEHRVGVSETSSKYCGKPWNKAKAMFSSAVHSKIASDSQSSSLYFHGLPYSKRIKLLKQTKTLTDIPVELAESLASSLKLNPTELKKWLWLREEKNRKIALNRELSTEEILLLDAEFELSTWMIENRSLLLSYELEISPDVIRLWFNRRKKLKKAGLPSKSSCLSGEAVAKNSAFRSAISSSGNVVVPENSTLRKSIAPAEKLIYSSSLSARIESLKETSFFYNLSPSNQLLLLKRFHDFPLQSQFPVADIAAELVSALTLSSEWDTAQRAPDIADFLIWLQETRKLYLKLAESDDPTSAVQEDAAMFLEDEFNTSNMVSDGRFLMLSYVLMLPVNRVRQWFYQRNVRLQEHAVVSISPATLSSTRVATSCTEGQFIQLMEMFKADGSTSSTNIEKVSDQTRLPPSQVHYWFNATQQSLRSFTRNQILDNLRANLSEYTIMELEERYCRSRRISIQQAAASASILGMEDARSVLSWFEWRRTYELLKVHIGGDIEESSVRIANILEGYFPRPPGILIDSSKYGICYDDSNCPIFPPWSDSAGDSNSAEEIPEPIVSGSGCASILEPSIESVSKETSSAAICQQE